MAAEFLNTLQELVVSTCDQLYAERELITKQAVKKMVQLHGSWSDAELDQQLPGYINQWRLHNLQDATVGQEANSLSYLQAQVSKYQAELVKAQQTINNLKNELLTKTNDIKILRMNIIKELRGLLDD